ncbi:DUF6484 domain-containing protein [Psychromonas sp.]|nr:DUF6484 domain-containing protein [Psychromonas sp.]
MDNKLTEDIDVFETSDKTEYSIAPGEIIIGTLTSVDGFGMPYVDFPQNPSAQSVAAISTLTLSVKESMRQVALMFNQGDLTKPILMGLIHSPLQSMIESFDQTSDSENVELAGTLDLDNVQVDGDKVIFEAKQEMVFKCGESSITLTKAGKILIRGKYLLNRSSGVNRIMGGSVQVN